MKKSAKLAIVLIVSILSLTAFLPVAGPVFGQAVKLDSSPKVIELTANQFSFEPSIIRVNAGDSVIFRIQSEDVSHGFFIDGFDFKVELPAGEVVEVGPITFEDPGKVKVRCALTCGPLHPFMTADIIVEPNYMFPVVLLLSGVMFGSTILYVGSKPKNKMLGISTDREIDILKIKVIGPILKTALQWRGIHFALILPNILIFMFVLAAGFWGNPTGNLNFSIAVVWILWFAAVEFMILFGGRIWCTLCPLPAFGEWSARRRIYGVHNLQKWFSLNKTFPKKLDNMWIGALAFLGISLIVPWLVTRPVVSGFLFVILIALGLIMGLVYTKRHFCRSICPAGAYIGYHATDSIFSVRSKDKKICDKHVAKECMQGSPRGYGCPWKTPYPGGLKENTYCGQCFECLKSCSLDNMTLKLRMVGKDLPDIASRATNKFDEAWMGFIRFVLAPAYILVFFGPYFWIKDWGNMGVPFGANLPTINLLTPTIGGFGNWIGWMVMVGGLALIIFPSIFYAFSWLAKKSIGGVKHSTRKLFLSYSYSLAPYGMTIWLLFALSLIMVNWSYPLNAFTDPLGYGWNILAIDKFAWTPIMPNMIPYIQIPILFIGLGLAINSTYNIGMKLFEDHSKAIRASVVMGTLHVLSAIIIIWILMG